jgi:hypothetical protein
MLKQARLLTRPTPARQDAPFRRQGRSSATDPRFTFHISPFTALGSDARTLLADCFSILLRLRGPSETGQDTFDRFLHHRILIFKQRKQGVDGLLCPETRE